MTRQEIIEQVHANITFFRDRWDAFCQEIETYAGELYVLEREAGERYEEELDSGEFREWVKAQTKPHEKELGPLKKAYDRARKKFDLERKKGENARDARKLAAYQEACAKTYNRASEPAKLADPAHYSPQSRAKAQAPGPGRVWTEPAAQGWLTHYLQPPKKYRRLDHRPTDRIMRHGFWRPVALVNPVAWFGERTKCPDMDIAKLPDGDPIIRAAVLLSLVHDDYYKGKGAASLVYYEGTYPQDSYFMADRFMADMKQHLHPAENDVEIQGAWNDVRDFLLQVEETGAQPNGRAQAGETAVEQIQLEDGAYKILRMLGNSPTRLKQDDLGACEDPLMDRKTVRRHLATLAEHGLIQYEPRNKKGAAITQKGRDNLNSLPK